MKPLQQILGEADQQKVVESVKQVVYSRLRLFNTSIKGAAAG
jgi:hypothetical protein